eukprot:TRINITY_DN10231_c0_g1_i1.p1 TRINITY_DN10231_c0_g1~~TRINITY_DN10231_c0_g1_i1.p1  ORF type:complete len:431 (-),score=47.80 TRINITY_DN10231_c0_g1_i1:644-1936(-)
MQCLLDIGLPFFKRLLPSEAVALSQTCTHANLLIEPLLPALAFALTRPASTRKWAELSLGRWQEVWEECAEAATAMGVGLSMWSNPSDFVVITSYDENQLHLTDPEFDPLSSLLPAYEFGHDLDYKQLYWADLLFDPTFKFLEGKQEKTFEIAAVLLVRGHGKSTHDRLYDFDMEALVITAGGQYVSQHMFLEESIRSSFVLCRDHVSELLKLSTCATQHWELERCEWNRAWYVPIPEFIIKAPLYRQARDSFWYTWQDFRKWYGSGTELSRIKWDEAKPDDASRNRLTQILMKHRIPSGKSPSYFSHPVASEEKPSECSNSVIQDLSHAEPAAALSPAEAEAVANHLWAGQVEVCRDCLGSAPYHNAGSIDRSSQGRVLLLSWNRSPKKMITALETGRSLRACRDALAAHGLSWFRVEADFGDVRFRRT